MLEQRKTTFRRWAMSADLVASIVSLQIVFILLEEYSPQLQSILQTLTTYPFNLQGVSHLYDKPWVLAVLVCTTLFGIHLAGFYRTESQRPGQLQYPHLIRSLLMGGALTVGVLFFLNPNVANRSLIIGFFMLFNALVLLRHTLFQLIVKKGWLGGGRLDALLVCHQSDLQRVQSQIDNKERGDIHLKHAYVYEKEQGDTDDFKFDAATHDLSETLKNGQYDVVILAPADLASETSRSIIAKVEEQGLDVWLWTHRSLLSHSMTIVDYYAGKPVIILKSVPHYEGQFYIKRIFDVLLSSLGLIILSPVFLMLALVIKLQDGGPVLFKQSRSGLRGKPFDMLKFRTMRVGAEAKRKELEAQNELKGPVFKMSKDPRVTRMGRFLRKYSLDELPQLWNVIIGDMSLVGPRPLPIEETLKFPAFADRRRLSVLPGITGLWQVSGRSDIDDFEEWVKMDLEYIDKWSLWLDLKILGKTIPTVLVAKGAK